MTRERRRQLALVAKGLCSICGKNPLSTKVRCAECNARRLRRGNARYHQRRSVPPPNSAKSKATHPDPDPTMAIVRTASQAATESWWIGLPRPDFYERRRAEQKRMTLNARAKGPDGTEAMA